jgi:formylmethanofuran dehydrogenase subunit E
MKLPEDLKRCAEFHGHLCPGLTIGWRAARAGLEALGGQRARDEEMIAIVENDSCAVDAVQALTGCTFGKGNLFFRDYGKMVFTFAVRPSGRAVRVAVRGTARRKEPRGRHPDRQLERLLEAPSDELFDIREMVIRLPKAAEIRPSTVCDWCGEPVMVSRTRKRGSRTLCIPCARKAR